METATSRYGPGNPKIAPKILSNLPIHGFFLFIGQVEGVRIAMIAMMAGVFFSISIYICILKRLRHYLVTSPNKNPMYCFKVLVVSMVWSFQYVPWCPVLKRPASPQFRSKKSPFRGAPLGSFPTVTPPYKINWLVWVVLSLLTWRYNFLHSYLSKTWAVRGQKTKKLLDNYFFSGVVYIYMSPYRDSG